MLVILGLALLIGGALRFTGLNWGEGVIVHPDESFVAGVTTSIVPARSLAEYFDSLHTKLNPNNVGKDFYVYGTLPVFLTRYAADGQDNLAPLVLVGRRLSALADWLVIGLVFLTGKRLFDARIGLLGAFLYAASALPIQQAHFYTVDTFANLFTAASLTFAARVLDARWPWLEASLFGVMLGLGMASKITAVAAAAVLALALLIRWVRHNRQAMSRGEPGAFRWPSLIGPAAALALGGLLTLALFRIGQPYAFLPPGTDYPYEGLSPVQAAISRLADPVGFRPNPLWLKQMQEASYITSGDWDAPPNHQWATRAPWLFPLWNIIAVGLGWPLGVIAWLAALWSAWEIARGSPHAERLAIPAAWVLLIFLWQGSRWVMTVRYFLPIYPALAMLAAWAPFTLWDRVQRLLAERGARRLHPAAWVGAGVGLIAALGGLLWGVAVASIYHRPMTRVAASYWVAENIPSDVTFTLQTLQGERRYEYGMINDWEAPNQPYEPVRYTRVEAGMERMFAVQFPFEGALARLRFNHIASLEPGQQRLLISLAAAGDPHTRLFEESIEADFYAGGAVRGAAYEVEIEPLRVTRDQTYFLTVQPVGSRALIFAGSTLAHEGGWDWPVPFPVPPYNFWDAQYHGYQLEIAGWGDSPEKVERLITMLNEADTLTLSSNRFYHSLNRNPQRWPLAIAYYQALFSGELGFELAAEFTSRPALGPVEFCDDSAEEAWTVYDHPRVFIFRKAADYDPARVEAILRGVDLSGVRNVNASDVTDRPVPIEAPGACRFIRLRGSW